VQAHGRREFQSRTRQQREAAIADVQKAPGICARDLGRRSCLHGSFEIVARFDGFRGAIEAREFLGREKAVRFDYRDHAVFEIGEAAIPSALFALKGLR